jgi:hypothetical protein
VTHEQLAWGGTCFAQDTGIHLGTGRAGVTHTMRHTKQTQRVNGDRFVKRGEGGDGVSCF